MPLRGAFAANLRRGLSPCSEQADVQDRLCNVEFLVPTLPRRHGPHAAPRCARSQPKVWFPALAPNEPTCRTGCSTSNVHVARVRNVVDPQFARHARHALM